jgi:hypothetical protein
METATQQHSKTRTLKLMKSTGNTHVYQEEGNDRGKQVFPTVYLQKHNFMPSSAPPPDTIELTLTWGDKP